MIALAPALAALLLAVPAHAKELGRLRSKDGLVLVFRASPVSNLVYHLNCLVDNGSCTKEAYRGFWDSQSWSAGDAKAQERWAKLMNKYGKQLELDEVREPAALPTPGEMIDLRQKTRIVSFRSDAWDDYASSLPLVMSQEDAREAIDILKIFRPRFERWWAAVGRARAERAAEKLLALIKKEGLAEFYGKVARFYGYAYRPGTVVEFDIMAQPDNQAQHSSGEQVDGYSVVEIVPDEDIRHRIDVVSHELFHYFYESAPPSVRARLIQGFADAPEPYAFSAFGILNEAVATAFGQGLVSRKVLPPDEFARFFNGKDTLYAESEVNDSAKALVPVLDGALARGATIAESSFVDDYLDAVSSGLGARLSSAEVWFRACSLVFAEGMSAAKERFEGKAHPNSVWGNSFDESARHPFEEYAGLSGALFLRPQDVGALKAWSAIVGEKDLARLAALAKAQKAFVYGIKRSDKAYVYVFVGADANALLPVVDEFFKSPAMFTGLLK